MSFAIRAAQPRDTAELLRITAAYAAQLRQPFTATQPALEAGLFASPPRAQLLIAQDTAPTAQRHAMGVLEQAPHTVGFALWRHDLDLVSGDQGIYIDDLFLEQDWRGRGISLAFFATLARRALDEGCTRLRWSALVGQSPGVSLYRSLSAIPLSCWTSQTVSGDALRALAG